MNSRSEIDPLVLLIGGAMRSGTTLLQRALCAAANSNPYLSECQFLQDICSLRTNALSRYDINYKDQFGNPANLETVLKQSISGYLSLLHERFDGPDILILKHPDLSKNFLFLGRLFPNMRFLAVVRDPRDVISSIKEVKDRHVRDGVIGLVARLKNVGEMTEFYRSYYREVLQGSDQLRDRIIFVRYEDVLDEPEAVITRIAGFCDTPMDANGLSSLGREGAAEMDAHKASRMKEARSAAYWTDLYMKDMTKERVGRYAHVLTPQEVSEIEQRLAPFGKRFGYWS